MPSAFEGQSLDEVSERVRGEPGTSVILEVERMGQGSLLPFEMERRAITLDAVVDIEMKSQAVGYCLLRQFTEKADIELAAAILELQQQGMQALILDLRGNPGSVGFCGLDCGPVFRAWTKDCDR